MTFFDYLWAWVRSLFSRKPPLVPAVQEPLMGGKPKQRNRKPWRFVNPTQMYLRGYVWTRGSWWRKEKARERGLL